MKTKCRPNTQVVTLITDFAALYLLPDAKIYSDYKFETTPDFSDLRQSQQAAQLPQEGRSSLSRFEVESIGEDGDYATPLIRDVTPDVPAHGQLDASGAQE